MWGHLTRFFHWYFAIVLVVLALAEHWIDEYLDLLDDKRQHEILQQAVTDCGAENGVIIEEPDLERALESADESGVSVTILFQRLQFVCLVYNDEQEDDDDE